MGAAASAQAPSCEIVAVSCATYTSYEALEQLDAAVDHLVAIFAKSVAVEPRTRLRDPAAVDAMSALEAWRGTHGTEPGRLIFYWGGHGKREADGHFLVTRDSPRFHLSGATALRASELGAMLAKSSTEKVLILLDTCYSGAGAVDVMETVSSVLASYKAPAGVVRAVVVIASSHALEKAGEGEFCRALADVLEHPETKGTWGRGDRFIHTDDLVEALQRELLARQASQAIATVSTGYGLKFVPNPLYEGFLAAEDVETRRAFLTSAAADHFRSVARGIETGETGWYFSGRGALLQKLVSWLNASSHGVAIVTGPPGAGKSAVLGRLLTLADRDTRSRARKAGALADTRRDAIPREGSFDVGIHVRGKRLPDFLADLRAAFGVAAPPDKEASPWLVVKAIGELRRPITIAVDALDEAVDVRPISATIAELGRLATVRILVACRYSLAGRVVGPDIDERTAELYDTFGPDTVVYDLADDEGGPADIEEYARKRLASASAYQSDPLTTASIARKVAEAADGSFLYARVVTRTLADLPDVVERLPSDAIAAFVGDLDRFGTRRRLVEDFYRGLAWAEGQGLTRGVWATVASCLARRKAPYQEDDVRWVLEHAGWHILETSEAGETVYRLYHHSFTEYFRAGLRDQVVDTQRRVTRALRSMVSSDGGADWLNADGYLGRYLAAHAAQGHELDTLVSDPGYLAIAEPQLLLRVLGHVSGDHARYAAVYARVGDRLRDKSPIERMALLHLTAHQEDPSLASELRPPLTPSWITEWAHWRPTPAHRTFEVSGAPIFALAVGSSRGQTLVIAGCDDGSVFMWDVLTGQRVGDLLGVHTDRVAAAAVTEHEGRLFLATAGHDGIGVVWDVLNGQPYGAPFEGDGFALNAVACQSVDAGLLVAAGDDSGTIWTWNPLEGTERSATITAHDASVNALALRQGQHGVYMASGYSDGVVHIWDVGRGHLHTPPFVAHGSSVTSIDIAEVDGDLTVATASEDTTAKLWPRLPDASTYRTLRGHTAGLQAVALGHSREQKVVITGSSDRTVRVWDVDTATEQLPTRVGHTGGVNAVAFGEAKGAPIIASGGWDGTLRLWEAAPRRVSDAYGEDIGAGEVVSLSAIRRARHGLLAVGFDNGLIRLHFPENGDVSGDPLRVGENLTAVTLGSVAGSVVVAGASTESIAGSYWSGTTRGVVGLWDADTGVARYRAHPFSDPLRRPKDFDFFLTSVQDVSTLAIGVSGDPPLLAYGRLDGRIRLLNASTGETVGQPIDGHEGGVISLAFGHFQGRQVLVSSGRDGTIRLWDGSTGASRGRLEGGDARVTGLAFANWGDTTYLVSGGWDGDVRLWDLQAGAEVSKLVGRRGRVNAVAVGGSHELQIVVAGYSNGELGVWDAGRRSLIFAIPIGDEVLGLAVDGAWRIVVGCPRGVLAINLAS